MILSVIIPTRNRAQELENTLNSIVGQTISQEHFEVLVVDNGSTDNTVDIVKQFSDRIKNVHYFFEPTPGLHVGRHCGLKNAQTEILVYADDDIQAFPTWLATIKQTFAKHPEAVLVGGKNLPMYEEEPPSWVQKLWSQTEFGKCIGHYSILDFGDEEKEISPYYVWGCNFSIRRQALMQLGGFHPDGMPKELLEYRGDGESAVSEGVKNHSWKTVYHPDASVYHLVSRERMTLEYLYRRAYAQGISQSYTDVRRFKGNLKKISTNALVQPFGFSTIKRQLRRALQYLQGGFDKEMKMVNHILQQGFTDGYNFHQQRIRENPELLLWVLRENYFDL